MFSRENVGSLYDEVEGSEEEAVVVGAAMIGRCEIERVSIDSDCDGLLVLVSLSVLLREAVAGKVESSFGTSPTQVPGG